ncbi:hypothetical protein BGW36DRAFT_445519 [Talaromyces proteolyticus]|uniref:Uncharacterized protein n=1 Tax=Talaromyces proteolyticus TaxID=1131652 RepID=A0AAD4KVB1_9EURO|nr:uncharacterized protein BGW36DRAFT_445519 [Talaromyces proteolyticus]KAH8701893.1 hypothetical protein BGW36DRAFT_445519 [Talaromyces proteolyticus]
MVSMELRICCDGDHVHNYSIGSKLRSVFQPSLQLIWLIDLLSGLQPLSCRLNSLQVSAQQPQSTSFARPNISRRRNSSIGKFAILCAGWPIMAVVPCAEMPTSADWSGPWVRLAVFGRLYSIANGFMLVLLDIISRGGDTTAVSGSPRRMSLSRSVSS